jgi:hypothetical protein
MKRIVGYLKSLSNKNIEILVLLTIFGFYYLFLSQQSFQMDFNAFYYASQTIRNGLNPYYNHILVSEDFFDAFNLSNLSRFLYPPSSLMFFYPLSMLDYFNSRMLFSGIIWIALFGSILLLNKKYEIKKYQLILVLLSFPVISNFERGQIDIIILFLVLMFTATKSKYLASMYLSIAISIKLTPIFILIYLFFKRDFKTIFLVSTYTGLILIVTVHFMGHELYFDFFDKFILSRLDVYTINYSFVENILIENIIQTKDGVYVFGHNFIHGNLNLIYYIFSSLLGRTYANLIIYSISLIVMGFFSYIFRLNKSIDLFYLFLFLTVLPNHHLWIMGMIWYIPFCFYLLNRYQDNFLLSIIIISPLLIPRNLITVFNKSLPGIFYQDYNFVVALIIIGVYLYFNRQSYFNRDSA